MGIEKLQIHDYKISYPTLFCDCLARSFSNFCTAPIKAAHHLLQILYGAEVRILKPIQEGFQYELNLIL